MELVYWAETDVGRVRKRNEDNFLVDPSLQLFIVCDGMGGHAEGDLASSLCVRIVHKYMSQFRELFDEFDRDPKNMGLQLQIRKTIQGAILAANRQIFEETQKDASKKGMGTTCSLLFFRGNLAFVGHVGDSRIYLSRQGLVHQLTEDHSLGAELERHGAQGDEVSEGGGKIGKSNAVTRAVGARNRLDVALYQYEVVEDDAFLLCSDGLSGYSDDDQALVKEIFAHDDIQEATSYAIEYVNKKGGFDNVTCIMVKIDPVDPGIVTELSQAVDAMRRVDFLSKCTEDELLELMKISSRLEVPEGVTIPHWKFDESQLFILLKGRMQVQEVGDTTNHISTIYPSDFFGPEVFFGGIHRDLRFEALKHSILFGIGRKTFAQLLEHNPQLVVKIVWPLSFHAVKHASSSHFEVGRARVIDQTMRRKRREFSFGSDGVEVGEERSKQNQSRSTDAPIISNEKLGSENVEFIESLERHKTPSHFEVESSQTLQQDESVDFLNPVFEVPDTSPNMSPLDLFVAKEVEKRLAASREERDAEDEFDDAPQTNLITVQAQENKPDVNSNWAPPPPLPRKPTQPPTQMPDAKKRDGRRQPPSLTDDVTQETNWLHEDLAPIAESSIAEWERRREVRDGVSTLQELSHPQQMSEESES